jgi:hypothetical protein
MLFIFPYTFLLYASCLSTKPVLQSLPCQSSSFSLSCHGFFVVVVVCSSFLTCHSHCTVGVLLGYFSFRYMLKIYSSLALLALEHSVVF